MRVSCSSRVVTEFTQDNIILSIMKTVNCNKWYTVSFGADGSILKCFLDLISGLLLHTREHSVRPPPPPPLYTGVQLKQDSLH